MLSGGDCGPKRTAVARLHVFVAIGKGVMLGEPQASSMPNVVVLPIRQPSSILRFTQSPRDVVATFAPADGKYPPQLGVEVKDTSKGLFEWRSRTQSSQRSRETRRAAASTDSTVDLALH